MTTPGSVLIELEPAVRVMTVGIGLRCLAFFTDLSTGLAADPTEVTFAYIIGSNEAVQVEYTGPSGTIKNPAVGEFLIDLDTTSWSASDQVAVLQWASQGVAQTIGTRAILLKSPAAVPTFA